MNIKVASCYILGVIFVLAGISHFSMPAFYSTFLPPWWPLKDASVLLSGVLELGLGVGLFLPRLRTLAAIGVLILLVAYLPLHIVDLNRHVPVVGSKAVAWVRLPVQVLLILMAYLSTQWNKR